MTDNICLVLHRKSANRPEVKLAVNHVKQLGQKIRVRIAWNKNDKRRVVKEALKAGATRIIAGGGDGTINDVVNALINRKGIAKATLGIMPLGTANDFARGFGLPVDDLGKALEVACTGAPRKIDVGKANDRLFLNVVSGGFGAEVTATTPQDMKKALGGAAYTLMGLAKAREMKAKTGRLLVPGEAPFSGSMLIMAVGNNRFAGGGFAVAPHADLEDGLLDLAVLEDTPPSALPQVIRELEDIRNPGNQYVRYRQLAEFTIDADTEVHFNVDGEPVHTSKMAFSVLPRCLGVASGDSE
jgi:lipid kinase YegS